MKLPMKSRLLQLLYEKKDEAWDYELVSQVLEEYGKSNKRWRWTVRFWTAELVSSGLFHVTEVAVDDGTHFGKGKVLYRFKISEEGKSRALEYLM